MGLSEMARRTPPDRDRYVDFLRAFSITTVVFGHFFIALIYRRGGEIGVHNVVGVASGLWLVTWVLQVMPLFFFVGGFSNLKTYDSFMSRGSRYRDFMKTRAERLLKPTAVFLAVWTIVQVALHIFDVGGKGLIRLSFLPFGPQWFLIVYLGVVAATPLMLRLHRRYGVRVIVVLALLVAAVDALRFVLPQLRGLETSIRLGGDHASAALPNVAFVWLLAHQLGFFYADGSLARLGRRGYAAIAASGFIGLVVLTNLGIYPRSMVGTDIEEVSNMNPPTLCIVALTFWLVGLAMLLRPALSRWLERERPWMSVIFANSVIMTVFLWHLTAYLIAILLLWPIGFGHESDNTLRWWAERPVWLIVPSLILIPIVAVLARFERPPSRSRRSEPS